MMIEPSAGRLVARVCESLEKSAMADPSSPYAQRQLKAGLWAFRDVAARVDAHAQGVLADIADMERTLSEQGVAVEAWNAGTGGDARQRHLLLQAQIESFEAGLHDGSSPAAVNADGVARTLRALYLRMLERERAARRKGGATQSGK